MKPSTPNLRLIYLAAIALCVLCSLTGARGDDKPAPPLKVAVVNPARLLNEYKFTVKSDEELKKKQDEIVTELSSWDQHRLLSEADQRTLGLLAVKESGKIELSATEKATKQKLEDAYKHLFDEYLALQTKQATTPAEQERMKELTHLDSDTQKRIKDRQASAQSELQKQASDAQAKMDKDVHDKIAEVAKSKGYNLVFSSQIVFYCDNDITDDVLKALNAH